MDQDKFKDWKKKVDGLLGLQKLPADSLVRLCLADSAPIPNTNGSEPQPGPSYAITSSASTITAASKDIAYQILNDESLALSLLHEEEQAVKPEQMLKEMTYQAEAWVADVFRHRIGNFYDKSTLDTELDKVYDRIIEFAQVKYLSKCNEQILGLYDNWWRNVYYPTIESMNLNKKNTKLMIEAMFKKRFGGLEKRLCQKWCITYTSIDDVMNQLMEDDAAEMGLLKSLGSEWVGFYNDLKLIKATALYQTISYLREYEEELISLVKNDKNGFMGKDHYVKKCTSKPSSFKVPPGLCNGTKQKVVDLANHLNSRLDDIVRTEKAVVAAAAAYSLNQYETAMEQKLTVAKQVSEIDNLHENLKNSISIACKEIGEEGFSYAWNFDRMPLSKTLADRHRAFRSTFQARLAASKPHSVSPQKPEARHASQDLRNGAAVDPAPAPGDSTTGIDSKEDADEDQKDVKPEVKHEPTDSDESSYQQNGHNYAHVDVKTEHIVKSEAAFKVKNENESPPPLVKDEHDESSSESPSKPSNTPLLDSAESSAVIPEENKSNAIPPQTKQGLNESSISSVASQLSQQAVVKMSSLNPLSSKLDIQKQKPIGKMHKIKRRGIGMFLSQFKILYLVEGNEHKELNPTFEIPSKEEGGEATTFDLHQLLTSQSDKIDKCLNIGGQDTKPYNEVPMAYHLASIREMMIKQQAADQKFNESVVAVAIPASITSFSRNRLKVAMELAGMNRSLLVQITTSIAVNYSQKPMIKTDHKIVVAYVSDGLIEIAVFRIAPNKCIQLAAGINTTFPEVTEQHVESFGSTFKALWCDLLSKAGIEETSVHAVFAVLEKPSASAETVQNYSVAIRNKISEKSKLFFTRDCRIILAGLKTVSNYGSSLPNGLIEEVYPWKFVVKHPDPEKTEQLSDFSNKAKTRSSHEKVKVCNKPVIVQRLWHGGGANEELQFTLKPLPPHKASTFRLLTEISLHPEGILAAACIQKTEGICAPIFVLNHMPLEKDVEAAEQLKELRRESSEPPSKKSKTGLV